MSREMTLRRAIGHLAVALVIIAIATALFASPALAHCDTLDGPVVAAARTALATGNINHVLIWVRPEDAGQIRTAFAETLAVRRLGPEAEALADRSFFETLVRIHRAGEGAPYTGLKPAGADLDPAIAAADQAIATGSGDAAGRLITREVEEGLRRRLDRVLETKSFPTDDVAAGRAYVEAYVDFIHYVERLHQAAAGTTPGHAHEGE